MMRNEITALLDKPSLMDAFVNAARTKRLPIALFGCGNAIKYAFGFLRLHGLQASMLLDNDPVKIGSSVEGLTVTGVDEFFRRASGYLVLIVPQDLSVIDRMRRQLDGVLPGENVHSFDFIDFMIYHSIQTEASFRAFAVKNVEGLSWLYESLNDDRSRKTLVGFMTGRLTGDYRAYAEIFAPDNYFVSGIVILTDEEVFVDCGAFDGDTVKELIKRKPRFKKIIAFEADGANCSRLNSYIAENKLANIVVHHNAVWNEKATITFDPSEDMLSRVGGGGGTRVEAVRLDDVLDEKVTQIKMDIEGAEYEALQGAAAVIRRDTPRLTISVYHKYQDVVRIPQLIRSISPGYEFYLRHHSPFGAELVLYAINRRGNR
jgi:FkbM family methyltransferase